MKPHLGTSLAVLVVFFASAMRLVAESPQPETALPESPGFSVPSSADNVHWETIRLIRRDAQKFKLKNGTVAPVTTTESAPDLLILDRLVVKQRPPETLPPPIIETQIQEFFRTGTIAEHVGSQITTRFWMHPTLGLRLSFEF